MQRKLQLKRNEVSRRIGLLEDMNNISDSKNAKCRQKLIAELHTLDFALGRTKELDSDVWFKEVEEQNASSNNR